MNITLFWSTFTNERESLITCSTMDAVDRIHQMMMSIDQRLSVEVSDDLCIRTIIFSANGFRELIPTVEKIVNGAPKLSNFRIQAFKEARGFDFVFRNQELEVSPAEWTFAPLRNSSGTLAIMINTNSNPIEKKIIEVIVETGIGEIAFAQLANLFVATKEDVRSNDRWLPLKSLAGFLEWDSVKSAGATTNKKASTW